MTAKVIPLHRRRAPSTVTLTNAQAHAIAILLRDLRPYADSHSMVDRAIQLLTSPTHTGGAA